MLFSPFQNPDLTSVNSYSIISVRNGNPSFRSYLNIKLVKTDNAYENHRISNLMNSRRENDILSTAIEIHYIALIDSNDLQISNIAFNHVICVSWMEVVNSLKWVEVVYYVESWAVNYCPFTFTRLVNYEGELICRNLKYGVNPAARHAACHHVSTRWRISLYHMQFLD